MKTPAVTPDTDHLPPILAALRKRAPKARSSEAEAFASAFYKRMDGAEYAQHGAEGWAALVAGMLEFVRQRKRGHANIRLFNPNMKEHGWESAHTVVQVANDDMPFLVDSVTMALAERGIGVHVLGHPVIAMTRDKTGKLTGVGSGQRESLMHLEIDRQSQAAMAAITDDLRQVLDDVRAIVADWEPMQDRMREVAEELGARPMPVADDGKREAQEFLRWAANDHFTFLGYREYKVAKQGKDEVLVADEDSGMGLLRGKDGSKPRPLKPRSSTSSSASGSWRWRPRSADWPP